VFPPIEYLSWIEGRPETVAHNLASSDLRPATHADGSVPGSLVDLSDPPGATNANALAFAVAAQGLYHDVRADSEADAPAQPQAASGDGSATVPSVLVEKPGYEPMTTTPKGFGACVDRFRRLEGVLDAARVESAVGDRTTLVALTDRHNPTGRRADRDEFERTAAVATESDAHLLVDEVYAPFSTTPTDGPFGGPSIAGTDGVVVTRPVTKLLGLGGLRIGWLVADPDFVAAAERVRHHLPSVAHPLDRTRSPRAPSPHGDRRPRLRRRDVRTPRTRPPRRRCTHRPRTRRQRPRRPRPLLRPPGRRPRQPRPPHRPDNRRPRRPRYRPRRRPVTGHRPDAIAGDARTANLLGTT
jgi:hypothetical protein